MSIDLNVNGAVFHYPEPGDTIWGTDATQWAKSVTLGMLQKAGGLFTLTADANFGNDFGLVSKYFKSRTSNISDAGVLRLARPDLITWRNQANNGNNTLGVNSSNQLLYNGAPIASSLTVGDTSTLDLTLASNVLTGKLPNLGPSQDGYVFKWDSTSTSWLPGPSSSGVNDLDGDVTGDSDNNKVEQITGKDGYVLVKTSGIFFDGYATSPTITQLGSSGGGGGGSGELTIEGGVLKIGGGPTVVLHGLEFYYTVDEFNFGAAALCDRIIGLGFNCICPIPTFAQSSLARVKQLGDAALAAGLIVGWNCDAGGGIDRNWLVQPDIVAYMNSMPNFFVRGEIEVDIPGGGGDPTQAEYIDGCLSFVNFYREGGGTRVIQVGSYQGGRRLEYPLESGVVVCASDPLQKTMLGWQAYWYEAGTFYQGAADLPNGITGTLQGIDEYHALHAATCMGILAINHESQLTDYVSIINKCLSINQSFLWWDLWKDTEGPEPHINPLVSAIWSPPVLNTPTGDTVSSMLLPSLHLYFPGGVPEGGGGGGGGGGLPNGQNLTVKAQPGTSQGGNLHLIGGDGYNAATAGSVSVFNGVDNINTDFLPGVVSYSAGQAYNTHIIEANYTVKQSDTIIGVQNLVANITLTLATSTSLELGTQYTIKDMDGSLASFTVTIDAGGSDDIDGSPTYVMSIANSSVTISLIDDGKWFSINGGGSGAATVSNANNIILTIDNKIGFRKSAQNHFLFEEFESVKKTTLPAPGSGLQTIVNCTNTNWKGGSILGGTDGYIQPRSAGPTGSHPGVATLVTGSSGPTGAANAWINLGDHDSDGYYLPYYVGDVYKIEAVLKVNQSSAVQFLFGLSDNSTPALSQNSIAFFRNTVTDATVHTLCKNNSTATNTDTDYDPSTNWTQYTIIQENLGHFDFYINKVLKNSIATNIPSTKVLSPYFTVESTTLGGSERSIDIDYFSFESRDLGDRFSAPSVDIEFASFTSGASSPLSETISAGSDRLLVVAVARTGPTGLGSTATYNGVAMTVASNSNDWAQMFYMLNPPVGTANIAVTGSSIGRIMATQYNNIASFSAASQGDVQSFSFSPAVKSVMCFGMSAASAATPLSGCTERYDIGGNYYCDKLNTAGGTFTVGTSGASDPSAAAAVFLGFA